MLTTKQGEYVLPAGRLIIIHIDPASRIAYATPAFLSSSRFALDECLGELELASLERAA